MQIFAIQRAIPAASLGVLLASTALLTTGCETLGGFARNDSEQMPASLATQLPQTHLLASIPKDKINTASRQLAADGIKALDAKDYRKASEIFNLAVKTDITNSYLHFLNAVAYQFRGVTGESGLFPLAEQGYQMAVQFDNSNWLARYYGGLLAMQQHNYADAQKKIAEAALYAGKKPELLYDLAVASYYNHDPQTAAAALAGLRELLGSTADPRVLRASAIVAASLNQKEDSQNFLDQMRAATANKEDVAMAEDRVASWQATFERGALVKAQFPAGGGFPSPPPGGGFPSAPPGGGFPGQPQAGGFPGQPQGGGFPGQQQGGGFPQPGGFGQPGMGGMPGGFGGPGGFVEKQMVVVDVVILSTEEDNTHAMGVNLLDGLKIQFGATGTQTPGFLRTNTDTISRDLTGVAANTNTQGSVITRVISMPAVNYSLNIANANAKRSEVLARPTLAALGNQTSTFFSGVDVNAAAVSTGQGAPISINKEVGVKLAVTPEFLPNNMIKLNIAAERTFLSIPSNSVKFDYRLDTTKTQVNANVVMKFGETLILSGLSERDQSRDRDGVPLLQDIPIVQYLFSRNVTRDYYKSVLIMLTPRRAQYTNRSEEDVAADQAKATPSELVLAEFEAKYRPWFKPIPNIGEITKQLENSALYREFRSGDLAGSWQSVTNHGERLATALKFLFY
jgi:Flp pilus assembly protein TadD